MPFAKLDRDMIVDEAIALLREDGLDAVTLRQVARRLKVSPSSLYWHVADKEMLYSLMSSSIFRTCLDAVPPAQDWARWLHDFGLALWSAQTSIPDALRLINGARSHSGLMNESLERILGVLQKAGMPAEEALVAQRAVQALVTGWTTLRSVRPGAAPSDRESFVAALETLIEGWRIRLNPESAPA